MHKVQAQLFAQQGLGLTSSQTSARFSKLYSICWEPAVEGCGWLCAKIQHPDYKAIFQNIYRQQTSKNWTFWCTVSGSRMAEANLLRVIYDHGWFIMAFICLFVIHRSPGGRLCCWLSTEEAGLFESSSYDTIKIHPSLARYQYPTYHHTITQGDRSCYSPEHVHWKIVTHRAFANSKQHMPKAPMAPCPGAMGSFAMQFQNVLFVGCLMLFVYACPTEGSNIATGRRARPRDTVFETPSARCLKN